MAYTNAENQARFKARMTAAGYQQTIVWIKKGAGRRKRQTDWKTFAEKIKRLTADWEAERQSKLFNLFIGIAEGKKGPARKRSKA